MHPVRMPLSLITSFVIMSPLLLEAESALNQTHIYPKTLFIIILLILAEEGLAAEVTMMSGY